MELKFRRKKTGQNLRALPCGCDADPKVGRRAVTLQDWVKRCPRHAGFTKRVNKVTRTKRYVQVVNPP